MGNSNPAILRVMITLLTGSNSFEISRELARRVAIFNGEAERVDGENLAVEALPQLIAGATLFADKRLVIISDLSSNKLVWQALPEWLERLSDDVDLILVELSLDKRTKTYRILQKVADVKDFPFFSERDSARVEQWVAEEAKRQGIKIDQRAIKELIKRSLAPAERGLPVIDQWQLANSLEKLSVIDEITVETVNIYIDLQPVDSVFELFESALRGDSDELSRLLSSLELREDPYKVFGLLSGQVFQLAALSAGNQSSSAIAKDIGVHPFAVNKLASHSKKLNIVKVRQIVVAMSQADEAMKSSKGLPWYLIEQALMKVVLIVKG